MTSQPGLLATPPAASASSIAPRLAWGLFGFSLLLSLFGLVLLALSYNTPIAPGWGFRGFPVLFTLAFSTVGALITSRQPHNRVGWIFGLSGLANGLQFFLQEYAIYALLAAPGSLPGGMVAAWIQNWIWVWAVLPLWVFLPLTFPQGGLPSPRWRPVAWLAGISIVASAVGFAFDPEPIESLGLNNPLTFPGAHIIGLITTLSISLIGLAAVVSLFQRLRHATGDERQQLKWFFYAAALMVVTIPFAAFDQTSIFVILATLGIPIATGIAILKYRLYDIDLIIRRTLIYGALTALGFGLYFLAVGSASALLYRQTSLIAALMAIAVVAGLFIPARRCLQRFLDHFIPLTSPNVIEGAVIAPAPQPASPAFLGQASSRRVRNLAWSLWVLAVLLTLTTLFLFYLNWATPVPASWSVEAGLRNNLSVLINKIVGLMIYTVLSATIGVVVVLRRPQNPIGWLLCLAGCASGLIEAGQEYTIYTNFTVPGSLPGGSLAALTMNWLWVSLFTLFFWMMTIFPEGRLPSPRWRWLFWANAVFTLGIISAALIEQPMGSAFNLDNPLPVSGLEAWNSFAFWLAMLAMIIVVVGITVLMASRFRRAQGDERQQLKWLAGAALVTCLCVVIGLVLTFLLQFAPGELLTSASLIFLPMGIGIAILRYRLYDIDLIIRRTVVYGVLIGGLALVYFGGVAMLQFLSRAFTGPQSDLVVVAITLVIAALFNPVRRQFQDFIDRRFYREKVDFRQAFTAFARDVRTLIELPELLRVLVTRTTDLLHINHGAVFLAVTPEEGQAEFRLAEGRNLPPGVEQLMLSQETAERLREGDPVSQPKDKFFPLLVPLIAPAAHNPSEPQIGSNTEILIGVLALGPRLSEQDYDREDQTLLLSLADQAGTAIYVAQLIQEKQVEAARREETERQLEAYRHSPMGRAETLAQALISRPETALLELHSLAQDAEHDPDTADLLEHLTRALGYLGANLLTGLADGYHFIFNSQSAPELLPVGLRLLVDHLSLPEAAEIQGAGPALPLYRLCQQALEASAISQITHLLPELQAQEWTEDPQASLPGLADGLSELATCAEALHAYERVDTPQDKLAYLASAVERLSHLDRLARTELGSADRPIIQRVAAVWLAVVTGAMSDLQTRARIACQLLTRHTWAGEIISLAFSLRNEGRGAALNLKVSLVPAPEYTLLDETGQIERLSAGEERQVELRVRPRLAQGISQFRARFIILYDDPRGPDQIEHFADVVYLLADEGEFKFIPNPYVVGTPLQTGSSLFFGREDVIAFIQENLSAAHQNNLVLIGQRRTGKTSLLKQLPARLGDHYVPVYLDGQSLALDPGLPSFFLGLATEITFALEDRGLGEAPAPLDNLLPSFEDFADSPAGTFERKFLAGVRQLIGDRHLLLLLDEFEELEAAVRRGNIDASIFGFLRHLIQHTANLSVIFCGTHRLEELAADYWSVLFNISLYRHVAFLNQADAVRLVQEPVAPYGMRYDDLALDKMWRVTAGHPYFLQLLCHSLVNRHNKSGRNYVTVADVNAALDDMLASGEAHFVFLWTESSQAERLVLTALSRMMPLTGQVKPAQVTDYLAERGGKLDRRAVSAALHRLALRDILRANITEEASANSVEAYHWQLGLLGLWVEKYKSLSRVVEEHNG